MQKILSAVFLIVAIGSFVGFPKACRAEDERSPTTIVEPPTDYDDERLVEDIRLLLDNGFTEDDVVGYLERNRHEYLINASVEEMERRLESYEHLKGVVEELDLKLRLAIGIVCVLLVAIIVETILIYRFRKKSRDANITERKEQKVKERWWIGQASLVAGVFLSVMSLMQYKFQHYNHEKEAYSVITGIGASLIVFGITYLLRRIYQERQKPE